MKNKVFNSIAIFLIIIIALVTTTIIKGDLPEDVKCYQVTFTWNWHDIMPEEFPEEDTEVFTEIFYVDTLDSLYTAIDEFLWEAVVEQDIYEDYPSSIEFKEYSIR